METNDLAIKYKGLYQAAELMIANIREIGFDMTEYEAALKNISHSVITNVKNTHSGGFARANYEMDYSNGIKELNKLIMHLEKYDVYFKVLNSCEWLNMRLNDKHITNQELKEHVSEMAYNLKQIVKSDTMDYDSEKHIVELVYETAYDLIKLELMMTGGSQLYSYIKNEDINVSYFNTIIKRDLIKIDLENEENAFIRQKLFEIRKAGISSSYFDLDLIKGLLIHDGDNGFKVMVNEKAMELLTKIKDNRPQIKSLARDYADNIDDCKDYADNIKSNKKEIRKRLISFLVATSIMVGGGIGVHKLAKNGATGDKYLQTTEVYSSTTDDVSTETKEVFLGNAPSSKTIVRVYDPYKNEQRREYEEYDVSYLDFDNARAYYEYGVDNYEVVAKDGVLKTGNGDTIPDYENSYTEVIRETYKYLGIDFNEKLYKDGLLGGYIVYIIGWLVLGMLGALIISDGNPVIIGSIIVLYEETSDLLFNKRHYKNVSERANQNLLKILELINENDSLREEFKRLYETNKYLLDNPEELYQRFMELDNSEVKKLIKDNKNKR